MPEGCRGTSRGCRGVGAGPRIRRGRESRGETPGRFADARVVPVSNPTPASAVASPGTSGNHAAGSAAARDATAGSGSRSQVRNEGAWRSAAWRASAARRMAAGSATSATDNAASWRGRPLTTAVSADLRYTASCTTTYAPVCVRRCVAPRRPTGMSPRTPVASSAGGDGRRVQRYDRLASSDTRRLRWAQSSTGGCDRQTAVAHQLRVAINSSTSASANP